MVATPARIGFVMEEWRRATATTQLAKDRYGDLARESDDPVETFFDNVADAQVVADERQALLSQERRRFQVTTTRSLEDLLALSMEGQVPVVRYIDPDRNVNRKFLLTEISYDFAKDQATMTIWG